MTDLIERLAAKLPGPWDAIVGIPRGGLIVAAGLGYATDTARVLAFATSYSRRRGGLPTIGRILCEPVDVEDQVILLVEDATATGTLMDFARRRLAARGAHVTTAALWVSKAHGYRPDVWLEEVDVLPAARDLFGGVS